MKRTLFTAVTLLVGALGTLALHPGAIRVAHADDEGGNHTFTNADLSGSYGFSDTGTVTTPLIPGGPLTFSEAGRFSSDGQGHLTTVSTGNIGGLAVLSFTSTCTYSINPDGTGTATCLDNLGFTTILALVLDDHDREFRFVTTNIPGPGNPGFVISGSARRQ